MAETKSRSIRVEDALWEKFCALKGTQNEAFRLLLEQCETVRDGPDLLQKVYERAGRTEIMIEEVLELARSVPITAHMPAGAVEIGADGVRTVPVSNLPKNATCRHCGNRFTGPKFATICPECKSIGHTNDPRDCPKCGDSGTGGL